MNWFLKFNITYERKERTEFESRFLWTSWALLSSGTALNVGYTHPPPSTPKTKTQSSNSCGLRSPGILSPCDSCDTLWSLIAILCYIASHIRICFIETYSTLSSSHFVISNSEPNFLNSLSPVQLYYVYDMKLLDFKV